MESKIDVWMKICIVKLILFPEIREEWDFLSENFEIWNPQTSNGVPHSNTFNSRTPGLQFRLELRPFRFVLGGSVACIPAISIGSIDFRNVVHSRLVEQ